jgi:hypothetical protein
MPDAGSDDGFEDALGPRGLIPLSSEDPGDLGPRGVLLAPDEPSSDDESLGPRGVIIPRGLAIDPLPPLPEDLAVVVPDPVDVSVWVRPITDLQRQLEARRTDGEV